MTRCLLLCQHLKRRRSIVPDNICKFLLKCRVCIWYKDYKEASGFWPLVHRVSVRLNDQALICS